MTTKTQFKTDIARRYEAGESTYQIARDEECSHLAVFRELKRKQVNTGWRFWTERETEKLKKLYPVASNEELLKEFPNRGEKAIGKMANKLGLRKKELRRICKGCGEEFIIKQRHDREFCSKCVKKQWEYNNTENGEKRKKEWLQRNPGHRRSLEYREWANQYYKQLREESPKFRLDQSMSTNIYQSLRGKKAGRRWKNLVSYSLKELMEHLEIQFDKKMNWENYGSYCY